MPGMLLEEGGTSLCGLLPWCIFVQLIVCACAAANEATQTIQVHDDGRMYLYQSYFDASFQNVKVMKDLNVSGNLLIAKPSALSISGAIVHSNATELNYLSQAMPGQAFPEKAVVYSSDGAISAEQIRITRAQSIDNVDTMLSLTTKRNSALSEGVGTAISMKVKDNVNKEFTVSAIESVLYKRLRQ